MLAILDDGWTFCQVESTAVSKKSDQNGKWLRGRDLSTDMRASGLLKHNIDALLTGRRQNRKDLADWCRRSESWISKIFSSPKREIPLKYLDRIADFFGLATYQLFQPGISELTERRVHSDRRTGRDRRQSHAQRVMFDVGQELARLRPRRPRRKPGDDEDSQVSASSAVVRDLVNEFEERLDSALNEHPDAGKQASVASPPQPRSRARRGAGSGRHDPPNKK